MLGRVPSWLTRNGTLLLLGIVVLLLFASWMFRYPDILRARVVITSVNPPAELEARVNGTLSRLFVADNQLVESGEVLAMIENPASYEDVEQLKASLRNFEEMAMADVEEGLVEQQKLRLGSLQDDYSLFMKVYRDFLEFKRIDYHGRKILTARTELEKQREYTRSLNDRALIQDQAYELAMRRYNRDATLFEEAVISPSDLEESRREMLQERNKQQEIVSQIAENNIHIARTENQIVDLELREQEERSGMVSSLEESYRNILAAINKWEQDFLLVAPVGGSVTFTRFWSENQNVRSGEKVLTVVPAESGSILGKISLPVEGAGKVDIDDQVNIQFDNYPHLEYGMVRGQVSNISRVPDDDFYMVEVLLPQGLRTFYNKEIVFQQNMQGSAEILTDKQRLLYRILNPIRSALSRQREM